MKLHFLCRTLCLTRNNQSRTTPSPSGRGPGDPPGPPPGRVTPLPGAGAVTTADPGHHLGHGLLAAADLRATGAPPGRLPAPDLERPGRPPLLDLAQPPLARGVRHHSLPLLSSLQDYIYSYWCSDQNPPIEPLTAPVYQVANFRAWVQKDRDLGQAALGTFRSAIPKIHVGFDDLPVRRVTVIPYLIRGVGNLDPSRKARKPRYQTTWEIAPALEAIAELHPLSLLASWSCP